AGSQSDVVPRLGENESFGGDGPSLGKARKTGRTRGRHRHRSGRPALGAASARRSINNGWSMPSGVITRRAWLGPIATASVRFFVYRKCRQLGVSFVARLR